jgi:hypothetical protein
MNVFSHSGDAGDIISSLPAVRQLGGGTYILQPYPHRAGGPREPMHAGRAAFLLPLLRAQPYITEARFEEKPTGVTHDFTTLRFTTHKNDAEDSLADWHAKHVGISEVDTSPWLQAIPDKNYVGKVAVARSLRYNNHEFPWGTIMRKHLGNLTFIGYANEAHKLLTPARGRLPMAHFENALQMAGIIAAAKLCVMNQSFPLWLAMGLGKQFIASCWGPSPDVRLKGANGQYVFGKKESSAFYNAL